MSIRKNVFFLSLVFFNQVALAIECSALFPGPNPFAQFGTINFDLKENVTCTPSNDCSLESIAAIVSPPIPAGGSNLGEFNQPKVVDQAYNYFDSWKHNRKKVTFDSASGTAVLYIDGGGNDINWPEKTELNKNGSPSNLLVVVTNGKLIVGKKSKINAFIYADTDEVKFEEETTFNGAITVVNGKLTIEKDSTYNYDVSDLEDFDPHGFCEGTPAPTLHHYEITHDGAGSTCASETVTIRACADANCDSEYLNDISVDFLVGGERKHSPTFSGNVSFSFPHLTAETAALTLDNESVSANNPLECSGDDCNISYADTGCEDSCFAYFPDSIQGHDSSSVFKIKNTGKLKNDSDNVVIFPNLTDETSNTHDTCFTDDCAITGTTAAPFVLPAFQTTSTTDSLSFSSGTETIGIGGDNNVNEIDNLTINGSANITFISDDYVIDNGDFSGGTITFNSGSYWFNELEITGDTDIVINGPVTIFVKGEGHHFDIEDTTTINTAGAAKNLVLVSYEQIHLKNTAEVHAVLYSAGKDIHIQGDAQHFGAISVFGTLEIKDDATVNYEDISGVQVGELCESIPSASLELHFKFDEGTGQLTEDISGHNRDGTLGSSNNADTDDPTWVCEATGYQLDFDRLNNQHLTTSAFTPPADGVVAFWLKVPEAPTVRQRIFGFGDGWEIRWEPNDIMYLDINKTGSNSSIRTSSAVTATDTWMHIAVVTNVTNNTWSVYIDGVLDNSGSETLTAQPSSVLTLGTRTGNNSYFTGSLDDFRIYSGVLTADEIAALAATPPADCESSAEIYQIIHDGNGLTCDAEAVTIKACTNATCNDTDTNVNTDVTLLVNGVGQTVSIVDGLSVNASFIYSDIVTPAELSLSSNYQCLNTVLDAPLCEVAFSDSGFIFGSDSNANPTIPTQLSGKPSNVEWNAEQLFLQAVKTDDNTGACVGVFPDGGDVEVNLSYTCHADSSSCSNNLVLSNNSVDNNVTTTASAHNLRFVADSKAYFSLTYPDAGRIMLNAQKDVEVFDSEGNSQIINFSASSNDFVVKPFGFKLDFSQDINGANAIAADSDGSAFKKAGEIFTMRATAVQWQNGEDSAPYDGMPDDLTNLNDNATAEHFDGEELLISNTELLAPAAGLNGVLTTEVSNLFSNSIADNNYNYSEVGIIKLSAHLLDGDYLGTGDIEGEISNVGRFTPAYFKQTVSNHGTLTGAHLDTGTCTMEDWAYSGQTMMDGLVTKGAIQYALEPTIDITAYNLSGTVTQNYTLGKEGQDPADDFMKLLGTGITIEDPVEDEEALQVGSLTEKVKITADITPGTPDNAVDDDSNLINGAVTYTFSDQDHFIYEHTELSLLAPFTAKIPLETSRIEDEDGILLQMPIENSTEVAVATDVEVRFGRWTIDNAFGPETSELKVNMSVEQFNGTTFVINSDDSCIIPELNGKVVTGDLHDGILSAWEYRLLDANSADSLLPAHTDASITGEFEVGQFSGFSLTAPFSAVQDRQGPLDLEYEIPVWLKYDWQNLDGQRDGPMTDNPTAVVTFGRFRGNDRIIYWREVGN